jgi:hypothetical protein
MPFITGPDIFPGFRLGTLTFCRSLRNVKKFNLLSSDNVFLYPRYYWVPYNLWYIFHAYYGKWIKMTNFCLCLPCNKNVLYLLEQNFSRIAKTNLFFDEKFVHFLWIGNVQKQNKNSGLLNSKQFTWHLTVAKKNFIKKLLSDVRNLKLKKKNSCLLNIICQPHTCISKRDDTCIREVHINLNLMCWGFTRVCKYIISVVCIFQSTALSIGFLYLSLASM